MKIYLLYKSYVADTILIASSLDKQMLESYILKYKEYINYMSLRAQEIDFMLYDSNDWLMDGFNLPELYITHMELTDSLEFNVEDYKNCIYMDDEFLNKHTKQFKELKK